MNLKKIPHLKQIIIIIFLLILTPLVLTFAKFIKETFYNFYLGSKEFYFTSNRLKEKGATYQVNNWSGIGSFDITFDLLSSLNNKLYTSYDIDYKVEYSCSKDATCSIENGTGIIYSSTHSATVNIKVSPNRAFKEGEELVVDVSATSTNPYVKTLNAKFIYTSGKKGITYSITDEKTNPYLNFSITNANNYCTVIKDFDTYKKGDFIDINDFLNLNNTSKSNCISKYIKLTFDPNIILVDTTSSLLDNSTLNYITINNVSYIKEITFPIDALSSRELKFYKIDPSKNYTYPNDETNSIINIEIIDP
mgnify:FL=1